MSLDNHIVLSEQLGNTIHHGPIRLGHFFKSADELIHIDISIPIIIESGDREAHYRITISNITQIHILVAAHHTSLWLSSPVRELSNPYTIIILILTY